MGTYGRKKGDDELSFASFLLGGKVSGKKRVDLDHQSFVLSNWRRKWREKCVKNFFFLFLFFVVNNLIITMKNEHLNSEYFENTKMCQLVELRDKTGGHL